MRKIATTFLLLAVCFALRAQTPDPNFFIYLCFGQSNMEAGARPAPQDEGFDNPRFQFMAAVDMPRYERVRNHWYTAVPPICREGNNMGPVDFFGRTSTQDSSAVPRFIKGRHWLVPEAETAGEILNLLDQL